MDRSAPVDPAAQFAALPRRHYITLLVAIFVAIPLLGAGCGETGSPPNVLLIVLDTVRADSVGGIFNDRTVTPHIDRIAASGVRFENAYANAPWTLPTHATLFTGLAPSQHKAVHENFALHGRYTTLAEALSESDYATHGITSNPWVTAGRGLAQGFDEFETAYSEAEDAVDKGAARATELAIQFVNDQDGAERPFFLFVNYIEAHLPYAPPEAGCKALGVSMELLERREFTVEEAEQIIAGTREATKQELSLARTLYRCEVAYQDKQIGKLLDVLRAKTLLDNTMVVITADHGELLGGDGLMGHEFSLADDILHVPLVLRLPGRIEPGRTNSDPVSHLDVVPTVLDALGQAEGAALLEGTSLLDGRETLAPDRALLAEYSEPVTLLNEYWANRHPEFDTTDFAVSLRSIRKGKVKLVENTRGELNLIDSDRGTDAESAEDIARKATAHAMRSELDAWINRLRTARKQPEPQG